MNTIDLNGSWKLGFCDDAQMEENEQTISSLQDVQEHNIRVIEASVPGNFERDMQRAGLLPDLFYGKNLLKSQELELTHLFYSKSFHLSKEETEKAWNIVFEGIDTVSEIYLNGFLIGKTDNMLIQHSFSMEHLLVGENELFVHIIPVSLAAREYEGEMQNCSLKYNYDALHIRKSAYMWGWDIFPRILTAGIWRAVFAEEVKQTKIAQTYLYTRKLSSDRKTAELSLFYDVKLQREQYSDLEIELIGRCKDSVFQKKERLWSRTGCLDFSFAEPYLWWPRGSGDQNLYAVEVKLYHKGHLLDEKKFQAGIRTVELNRTSLTDEKGRGEFCFLVNHKKIFIKGTNWVPLSSFPSEGAKRIPKVLELVEDIGCNMIRCWGGGYYEEEEFYTLCDEKGILIWQDFMMACGRYPQDREFCEKLYREATWVIRHLRQHPSLALWAGDNECDEGMAATGFFDPNENVLTRNVLKEALRQNDSIRIYLPSSPYIDNIAYADMKNRGEETKISYLTENHLWGPRDYFKSEFYTNNPAHFVSETGYHGSPALDSVRRFISEEGLWPYQENEEWILHASSAESDNLSPYAYRIPLMANQIQVLFGYIPEMPEEFIQYSQISQGEAMKFFIERFRMDKWRRTGMIWWNMIDGCPQFSDAVVDYYFKKKYAYFYIKQSQQPICLMFREPQNEKLLLMGVNDTEKEASVRYRVEDVLTNELLLEGETTIPSDGAASIQELPLERIDQIRGGFLKMSWTLNERTFCNHYVTWRVPYDARKYIKGAEKCSLFPVS